MNLSKRPPDTFNIFIRHSPIGLIKINPETHSLSHLSKCANMSLHRLTTLFIKGSYSKFFDITFSRKSQLLLNCNLYWKTMAIPTCFADYILALHSLKAREYILKDSCFNMVSSWQTICSWWSFIKSPTWTTLTHSDTAMKYVLGLPEI